MSLLDAWYDLRSLANPLRELYDWLAGETSGEVVYVVSAVIGSVAILVFVGLGALVNVWLERRIIGRIQVRRRPQPRRPFRPPPAQSPTRSS